MKNTKNILFIAWLICAIVTGIEYCQVEPIEATFSFVGLILLTWVFYQIDESHINY